MPKCRAAARTVAPVSIMYTANSQARLHRQSFISYPPMLCAAEKAYDRFIGNMHLDSGISRGYNEAKQRNGVAEMIYFNNDYSEGCHEKVLEALQKDVNAQLRS